MMALRRETMGADGAFERRRFELALIHKKGEKDVSDDEVVQSYKNEVDPSKRDDNFMLQFLEKAELAFSFGTALFVHGAVTKENMGTVPGQDETQERVGVREWEARLNAWARGEVEAFKANPNGGTNTCAAPNSFLSLLMPGFG